MASRISEQELLNRAKEFVTSNFSETTLDRMIQDALITADRELCECDSLSPLAWRIHNYSGIRTRFPAAVSAITQASPGVFTAQSDDGDISGHGLLTNDIVQVSQVDGMEELNERFFLVNKIDATTLSLKSLDGLSDIDTTDYTEYDNGGSLYHFGVVLDASTILADVGSAWTLKRVLPDPTFDGVPARLISEQEAAARGWTCVGNYGKPRAWRNWTNMTTDGTPSQYLFWYPAAGNYYNVAFPYEKEVPDFSTWDDSTYPLHPPAVHDALWHGALAKLAGNIDRAKRLNSDGKEFGQVEVLMAQHWAMEFEKDKQRVRKLSRRMLGKAGGTGGFSA